MGCLAQGERMTGHGCARLTEEDLQGICVQLQVLGLLLHHIHVLCVLAVEAVDTGIGQHLEETPSGQCIQPESRATPPPLPPF